MNPDSTTPARLETATFGAGCFWCIEAVLERIAGVTDISSGYMGGRVDHPTYEQICTGTTGHAEVVQVTFDPDRIGYQDLLKRFFELHDPTTLNRQGADVGTQYRSAIFYHSEAQEAAAVRLRQVIDEAGVFDDPIVTEIRPATEYWVAEESHQHFYRRHQTHGYCRAVISPKLDKLGLGTGSAPVPELDDAEGWAERLKLNWGQRAASESRDFFVASHAGWDDPARWEKQARADIQILLHGLEPAWLRSAKILEIGCGVGRLAPLLLEATAEYTGFDIAAGMVEQARQRLAGVANARFLESNGRGVPAAAGDRQYDLAIALAVFIHCPRTIIEELARSAFALLRPGGRLRFQLLGDESDPTGIEVPPTVTEATRIQLDDTQEVVTPAVTSLLGDHYMGHAFGYEEARECFGKLDSSLQLYRFDPCHIYGEVVRDSAD